MKRRLFFTILATAVLAVGLLSGCGNGKGGGDPEVMEAAVIENRDAQLLVVKNGGAVDEIYRVDIAASAVTGEEDEELAITDIVMGDLVEITYLGLTEQQNFILAEGCSLVRIIGTAELDTVTQAAQALAARTAASEVEETEDAIVDQTVPAIHATVLTVWSEPRLTVFENGSPNVLYDLTLPEHCLVLDEAEQQIDHTAIRAGSSVYVTFDGVMVNTSPITVPNCIAVIITGNGEQNEIDAATANLAIINSQPEILVPDYTESLDTQASGGEESKEETES